MQANFDQDYMLEYAKQFQESLNQHWETEIHPVVYQLFHKDAKPTREGQYVEVRKRGDAGWCCDLNSLRHNEIEIACEVMLKLPLTTNEFTALMDRRGQIRAFNSLSRQVLCECCKTLNAANYRPKNTYKTEFFGQFINDVKHEHWRRIYAGATMSKITAIPLERNARIGFIVYLTISLWVEMKREQTISLLDTLLEITKVRKR